MKWIKQCLCFLALSIPLCSEVAALEAIASPTLNQPTTWKISQGFQPPERGGPPPSAGGATRNSSSSCFKGSKTLTPLIPQNRFGLTFAERPTFFWYVPESRAKTAEFLLKDDTGKKVLHETTFPLPNKPGIISYTLPSNAPGLKAGKPHQWYLTVVCDRRNPAGNPTVEGFVERTKADLPLSQELAKASDRKRLTLYANAGIWHEALTTIVQLRRSQPNNVGIRSDWRRFLQSVGLNAVATEPLVDCCTTQK